MEILDFLKPVLSILAVSIGGWLGRKLVKSHDDKARAEILTRMADDMLSVILIENPGLAGDWQTLIRKLLSTLADSAPTKNTTVLRRVATAAVERRVSRIKQ